MEATDTLNPRERLQAEEDLAAQTMEHAVQQQTAFVIGRIIVWLLAPSDIGSIGLRVYVLAYKLRPDIINGMTMQQIADKKGVRKSFVLKLAMDFTDSFGVRGFHQQSDSHRATQSNKWASVHNRPTFGETKYNHLSIINRLSAWINGGKYKSMTEQQLKRDFKPVHQFLSGIYKF